MKNRILLTGASGEIGGAIAQTLAREGNTVDLVYHNNKSAALQLAESLSEPEDSVNCYSCDLGSTESVEALCDQITLNEYVGFVHSAGMSKDALVPMIDTESAFRVMHTNFWSYSMICKALIRQMARKKRGNIVAISSVTAVRGNKGNSVYAASKGAIEAFNRAFVQEYASRGISINSIAPGFVETKMISHLPDVEAKARAGVPMGRLCSPQEVGEVVAFLMSPHASYVNGSVVYVDGGLTSNLGVAW